MRKTHKIMYWVATVWLSLGMLSTGIVQIVQPQEEIQAMARLGYPLYFLTLLGVWKIAGVLAILLPKLPLIKEWAYAGFVFAMSGALVSHVVSGGGAVDFFGPALLLVLTFVSWYYRPADRKFVSVNP